MYIEKWPTADAVQRFDTGCATVTCHKFITFLALNTIDLIFLKLDVKDWPTANSVQLFFFQIGFTEAGQYVFSVYFLETGCTDVDRCKFNTFLSVTMQKWPTACSVQCFLDWE